MATSRRRNKSGIVEDVVEIAWACPPVGAVLSLAMLLAAYMVHGWPVTPGAGFELAAPLMATLMAMLGVVGLLVSTVGFLRDLLLGK